MRQWSREAVFALGCAWAFGALAQQPASTDPFIKDAVAGFDARTYYLDQEDKSKSPTTIKEAWAAGGKLYGRTGYWNQTVQFGASYYFALPLYAPDDRDGTLLLAPGQESISVLGEAYMRLKYQSNVLTLGRQEIDMNYKRAAGVRGNRADATYVGKLDNRMVPLTYEAALLGGQLGESLNYYGGWINRAKLRNSEHFDHTGTAAGAKGSESDMWMGGLQFAPAKDFWVQGWYHQVSDVIRISYVDADYVHRLSDSGYFRLAGQYTDQRSDGSNALTGSAFSTHNTQVYGEYGRDWFTLYSAYSKTGSGADIRFPFSSGPIYTQQLARNFVRANESAWQLGIAGTWAPAWTAYFDITRGRDATNAGSGARLADEIEYDVGAVWTFRQKGSFFDGLRTRVRYGWVYDRASTGDQKATDFRIDINLPIKFL